MNAETAAPDGVGEFRQLPITALIASKTNPRTHFDDSYIGELSTSIREKGLIQPIVVRPNGKPGTFEIVAGECRFRASKLAALATVPAIVRTMTDDQVLEAQLEENIHRKDLTPLEEAAGYRRLIASNPTKHSAESIATRIGMSVGYVWDRLKLADLIPDAKEILEQQRMTVGHAILIARLKPEDQKRAVTRPTNSYGQCDSGLWRPDHSFNYDEQKGVTRGKYDGVKACSVRELEKWIQNHVRFDVAHAAQAQPLAFEQTALDVSHAEALPGRRKKVIPITHDHRVADDARDDERTYGRDSWKPADGKRGKTCEYSVLGVVVAGHGQGSTLQVCVNRDKCETHFGDVIRRKAKNTKLRESGHAKQAAKNEKKQQESYEAKWNREQAERNAKAQAWAKLEPLIVADALDQVKGKPLTPAVVKLIDDTDLYGVSRTLVKHVGKDWYKKPGAETWWTLVLADSHADSFEDYISTTAKPAGLNVKRLEAIRDQHQPPAAAAPKPGKKR